MSIKNRQRQMAQEEILQSYLTSGRYPEAIEIQDHISKRFKERPAGLPRFNPTPVEEDSLSNPDQYNQELKNLTEDLHISFDEMNHHVKQMIAVANSYETEKRYIQLSIEDIENRIDILKNRFKTKENHAIFADSMKTFDKIDFHGSKEQGIPRTDTLVDLRYGQVVLENVKMGGTKYDLSNSDYVITIEKGKGSGKEIRSLTNALKDTINQASEYIVASDSVEETAIKARIDLKETISITSVSLELHMPKRAEIKLFVADEREVFKEVIVKEGKDKIEWKLHENARYIEFVMTKNEPDYSHETTHEYYFGAVNVSVKYESYLPKGYFVSQPYEVNDQVLNRLRLTVKDVVFPKTNIRYYIGVNSKSDMIEWQEISPNGAIELNQLETHHEKVTSSSTSYGTVVASNFNVDYYSLTQLDYNPEPNTVKIRMGEYMWQVDELDATGVSTDHIPSLEDWTGVKAFQTRYIPVEQTYGTNSYNLTANTMNRFTVYLFCEEERTITNNNLDIDSGAKASVYVNNQKIKPVNQSTGSIMYTYRFKPGWNQIQIVTYANTASLFRPNLFLKDVAADLDGVYQIYGTPSPLEEVSVYNLYNNTSKFDFMKFAIENGNLIVNYNPTTLDETGEGMRYTLQYQYASENTQRNMSLRFMAVLLRSEGNPHVSPILKSYQIHTE